MRNGASGFSGACPFCGYGQGYALTATESGQPEPDEWALCGRCAEPLVLGPDLKPQRPPLGAYLALRFEDSDLWAELEHGRRWVQDRNARDPRGGTA